MIVLLKAIILTPTILVPATRQDNGSFSQGLNVPFLKGFFKICLDSLF